MIKLNEILSSTNVIIIAIMASGNLALGVNSYFQEYSRMECIRKAVYENAMQNEFMDCIQKSGIFNVDILTWVFAQFFLILISIPIITFLEVRRNKKENASVESKTDQEQRNVQNKLKEIIDEKSKINWTDYLNLLLFIIAVSCFIIAGYTYFTADENNKQIYSITQHHVDKQLNMTTWLVSYNFTSTVFSAQNYLDVSIIALPFEDYKTKYPARVGNITKIYVYLPETTDKNPVYDMGIFRSDFIEVTYDPYSHLYKGNKTLKFLSEGEKCSIFSEVELESTVKPCKNTDPIIHISSSDSLFNYNIDKITLSLTWLFMGFTVMFAHEFIKKALQSLARFTRAMIGTVKIIPNGHSDKAKSEERT